MRKSRAETAETRQRIVEVAAREFRANGIHATGLADVMAEAGLSHGGFYRHFESKDQLAAEACAAALTATIGSLEAAAEGTDGKESFKAIVDAYLSTAHRDTPATGCPLAGMGSELARAGEEAREAVARGCDELIDRLASRIAPRRKEAARAEAIFAVAAMIGAVTLSRIIAEPDASASVLHHVRKHLHAL